MPRFPFHLACLVILSLAAAAPGVQAAQSDQLNRGGFRAAVCNIDSMNVTFKVDEAFGEPLVTSAMSWSAGPNTEPDCLTQLTHVWVRTRTPELIPAYSPGTTAHPHTFGRTACRNPWSDPGHPCRVDRRVGQSTDRGAG